MTSAAVDRNCLSYWFPPIEAAGLPVPTTRIVRTDVELVDLLDGRKPEGYDDFLRELFWAGNEIGGRPFFLRTGHGSGKHDWRETCYVDEGNLGWHVSRLVEWSHTADMFGLPHEVWAVRRLLRTAPLFHAFGKGFPVTREFRVFIREDEIEGVYPYWSAEAIAEGEPDTDDWRDRLAAASTLSDDDAEEIGMLAGTASAAVGGGYWSIDFLSDIKGKWWLTDMAKGNRSFKPEPDFVRPA